MNILVTGAAGFIGSHLAERLVSLGHTVTGLDNFSAYYSPALKKVNETDLATQGIRIHRLDLAKDDLSSSLAGIDTVFHLAAQPGISDATSFDDYVTNNIYATYRLLEAVKKAPTVKRFLNIATSSIYGAFATDPETAAPKPTSYYGVTKLAAEQLVLAYQRDRGLPACSLRLFSVYGERERPEKLYPKLIKAIFEDKEFPLYEGSDKHLRSYTYVGDIIDGFVAVLNNFDKCVGQIFNIGCDTAITTGEGIRIVEDIIGKKAKIVVKPRRAGDQEKTQANIEKAKKILGYSPKVLPAEGLRKEVEWYHTKILPLNLK